MTWRSKLGLILREPCPAGGYESTLEDYLDTFFDGEDPPLMKDSDPPFEDVLEESLGSLPLLRDTWLARLVTWLVYGSKRLLLFSPEDAEHLAPKEKPHCSWDGAYLEGSSPLVGDAIFIPNGWWHAVEAVGGPAVSISGVARCAAGTEPWLRSSPREALPEAPVRRGRSVTSEAKLEADFRLSGATAVQIREEPSETGEAVADFQPGPV
eukprot:Skav232969  [mRNA]  locus=scaffold1735:251475:256559:+ [translate_table: standard]